MGIIVGISASQPDALNIHVKSSCERDACTRRFHRVARRKNERPLRPMRSSASRPQSAAPRVGGRAGSTQRQSARDVNADSRHLASESKHMVAQLETWLAQFALASGLLGRLIEELQAAAAVAGRGEAGGSQPRAAQSSFAVRQQRSDSQLQAVRSSRERQLDSHTSLLKLVAQRLAMASTQVQHTRVQAAALDALNAQLVASERERQRLEVDVAAHMRREAIAAAERRSLLLEIHELEALVERLDQQVKVGIVQRKAASARSPPASAPTPAPEVDMAELIRLQEVAREEAYQRFEALRELEVARAAAATAQKPKHNTRPASAHASVPSHSYFLGPTPAAACQQTPSYLMGRSKHPMLSEGKRTEHVARTRVRDTAPRGIARMLGGLAELDSPRESADVGKDGDRVDLGLLRDGGGNCLCALDTAVLPLRPPRTTARRMREGIPSTEPLAWRSGKAGSSYGLSGSGTCIA